MSTKYPGGIISKTAPVPTGPFETGTAPGVWTLEQQAEFVKQGIWPIAGNAIPYIEDVFSTLVYTGTGGAQTINNGIDLTGKGGMVWIKARTLASSHSLFDTTRGAQKWIGSNSTSAEQTYTTTLDAFGSTGFTVGGDAWTGGGGQNYASWTFREQPKFFDVVTWTGNGVANRQIPHNLGSVPGCVIVKKTNGTTPWPVYHRSLANQGDFLSLNATTAVDQRFANFWGTTPFSSTTFSVSDFDELNGSGGTYVAYLFAHNAGGFGATATDNVISCGSWTQTGSGATVTLGYEPQWILLKSSSGANNWRIVDNMRGMTASNTDQVLVPNSTAGEANEQGIIPTATGFNVTTYFGTEGTFIYIAIRRGPMRTPTTGTSVFFPQTVTQADFIGSTNVPFPPDLVNTFSRNGTNRTFGYSQFQFADRLRSLGVPSDTFTGAGCPSLISSSTAVEGDTASYIQLRADSQNITRSNGWNDPQYGNWIYYFMRRAPGFMDVVCYTGTGSPMLINHNLGVPPELIITKRRNATSTLGWIVSSQYWFASTPWDRNGRLNQNSAMGGGGIYIPAGSHSATQYPVDAYVDVNDAGGTYVSYLFATCPGVSKVGSYTGTGTTQLINCGFAAGARFVMIKRADDVGDWFVWDTARGMIPANDPYLSLNSTAAEVTGTDFVDTAATGFEITSTAPVAINASGGTFIFLAIA